jgi:Arc/MetJ-type ribon-helix-helix transcriptional regulator
MTIRLPAHLERYVHDQVQAGLDPAGDELVSDALERHRQAQQRPAKTALPTDLMPEEIADQELQRRLLEAGIISEIKPPPRLLPEREPFSPIPIQGEPLSETIIRERR